MSRISLILFVLLCSVFTSFAQKAKTPEEIRRGGKSCVDYIKVSINDFGRADFRFSNTSGAQYKARYKKQPTDVYETIEIEGQESYGARMYDAGKGPVIYLIVDEGRIEAIPVDKIVEGDYFTTLHSKSKDYIDVQLVDGAIKGVKKNKQLVDIDWKEKK